jgi:hypothetical protein
MDKIREEHHWRRRLQEADHLVNNHGFHCGGTRSPASAGGQNAEIT